MRKINAKMFCISAFAYYLCIVLAITQRPKIVKKAENHE